MEKLKKLFLIVALAVGAVAVIVHLFPRAHPYGGIGLPLDVEAVSARAGGIAAEQNVDLSRMYLDARLRENRLLVRQVRQHYGIEKGNALLRSAIPAYRWDMRWSSKKPLGISVGDESGGRNREEQSPPRSGDLMISLDVSGGVQEYTRTLADTIPLPSLTQVEAKEVAVEFLEHYSPYFQMSWNGAPPRLESEKRIEQSARTDFEFLWGTDLPEIGDRIEIRVAVAGNMITHYEAKIDVPDRYKEIVAQMFHQFALVFLYVILIIAMVVMAFKRIRAYEIGFRLALIVGATVAVALGIRLTVMLSHEPGWEFLLAVILGPLFYGGGLVLVWAVGETLGREVWKEKFVGLDLLSRGIFLHTRVGEGILRGVALGATALAVWLASAWAVDRLVPLWVGSTDDGAVQVFDAFSPSLYVLTHSIYANAYTFAFFLMFLVSFLRRRVASDAALIAVGAVCLGVINQEQLQPLWAGILIQTGAAAVLVWSFYRYDVLTAITAMVTMIVLREAAALFVVGNPEYALSAWSVTAVAGLVGVGAGTAYVRRERAVDLDAIAPSFARHITERQRLQQELEIARQVQMSFLPKANPRVVRLDIASRCTPALEIGGDYYDFIELEAHRLGVAVGDVSGKGTQAAFFMTLTKGFLQALARVSDSPAAVLTQVNRLFYENVDRGVFISMVYGIFDTQRNILRLARAGHNPVIMSKTRGKEIEVLHPTGLALGLDEGEAFERSIQEETIPFQSGDLFVFYTDGFPEAMNRSKEEYGEDRLCRAVQRHSDAAAAEIMEGIFRDMQQFVGKAKQHDDLSIVVVKIT